MKKKKIIVVKDSRLKKLRNNLRMILIQESNKRLGELLDKQRQIRYNNEGNFRKLTSEEIRQLQELELKYREYNFALDDSICICKGCHATDKDMGYNPILMRWYCIDCYKEFQNEYLRQKPIRIQEGDWNNGSELFYKSFL